MSEQYVISAANLDIIENNLKLLSDHIVEVSSRVDVVDENVRVVYSELTQLAKDFDDFIKVQIRANRKQVAHTELVRIRQELEKKYGHYDIIRRTTTGILQADDLGIIKKDTISNATEELMISTPNYWLAPCLVALAAWIKDQPELAEKALKEGIKRNDEKTSLFFTLICRRADRKSSALKWTQRYLGNQDEESLDRKAIIILDAYASGLLGIDSEGIISRQMEEWLERLSDQPGFIDRQTEQWAESINIKRKPLKENDYTYLKKYSRTWNILKDVMEGAHLHQIIFDYFTSIFNQQDSTDSLKVQLDEILDSLVTDFDDEELPLRKEEMFEQFIIDFDGDEARARQNMQVEKSAFETRKDFTQLLTDAAMKPESTHARVSTQKFAIALSKEWITNAYNDLIAKNRMKVPNEIEINVDTFNDKTTDGKNEIELLEKFNILVNQEEQEVLKNYVLSAFEKFCLYGGIAIPIIGLIMLVGESKFLGLISIIAGIGMIINHFSKKKVVEKNREIVRQKFEEKRINGSQIIRATLAEVVDFRAEFTKKDSESKKVLDFLEQITPDQYVKKLSDSNRKIDVSL